MRYHERVFCLKYHKLGFLFPVFQLPLLPQVLAVGNGKLVPDEVYGRGGQVPEGVRVEGPQDRGEVQQLEEY